MSDPDNDYIFDKDATDQYGKPLADENDFVRTHDVSDILAKSQPIKESQKTVEIPNPLSSLPRALSSAGNKSVAITEVSPTLSIVSSLDVNTGELQGFVTAILKRSDEPFLIGRGDKSAIQITDEGISFEPKVSITFAGDRFAVIKDHGSRNPIQRYRNGEFSLSAAEMIINERDILRIGNTLLQARYYDTTGKNKITSDPCDAGALYLVKVNTLEA